jgi:nitroreductase/NAD-dependent dihydropyrimidine dehydrogenase PreA subunit
MDRPVRTVIDQELCVGCGQCVPVCPTRALELVDGKARVVGQRSIYCGHCAAACPTGAIAVEPLAGGHPRLAAAEKPWLAPGEFDAALLERLMASRRSCRNYRERPVPREVLAELVQVGATAPSGTNSQRWTFTVLPDRRAVLALAEPIGEFFRRLNAAAAKPWLRNLLRLVGRPELARYHREHRESVAEALAEWEATGRERLFHGAPAAILVGSLPGGSTPVEDALLAAGQILLAAHARGLGTCLVGYAVEVLSRRAELRRLAGLSAQERVHAVIAVGWPREAYERPAGRLPVEPRWFSG